MSPNGIHKTARIAPKTTPKLLLLKHKNSKNSNFALKNIQIFLKNIPKVLKNSKYSILKLQKFNTSVPKVQKKN